MNNMSIGFSWLGIVIFILPMLINILYVILPPANSQDTKGKTTGWIEIIEQVTRILYLFVLVLLESKIKINYKSAWMIAGCIFLILYYIVWIRYFVRGREITMLSKSFLFVPMPLAVFPVLYFICAAVWMHNIPAMVVMVIFGIAHNIISYQSFKGEI